MCALYKRWFGPDENGAHKNTLELFLTQNSCYTLGLHEQRAIDCRQKETLLVPVVLSQENTSGRPSATYSRQEGKGLTFRRLQPRRLQNTSDQTQYLATWPSDSHTIQRRKDDRR